MNRALQASDLIRGIQPRTSRATALAAGLWLFLLLLPGLAAAGPFIWDQDDDRIDDRIESVHLLGYTFSFENADPLQPQRIQVLQGVGGLTFGAYVVFDHVPTNTDLTLLTFLGMPVLHRYESVTAVRTFATFLQVEAALATLSGVERIESVALLYSQARDGAADIGARDPSDGVFPTWYGSGGADGSGVVVAILDTGINDAPDGSYPGHESLIGRCVGGASFVNGDSLLDTPPDGSVNPVDRGGLTTHAHGTHVAGIVLGSGGASGYAAGIAPGAKFVDVKVLPDAGSSTTVGDGIDWCIHNRNRAWGGGATGIQVMNLSLSSPDETDGNDVVSRLCNRAVDLGIVVVASMGNAGHDHFTPSPAGANNAIAVGAMDDQRTGKAGDDQWASSSNYGPRADNGDPDPANEARPDLLAPGLAVLSADGNLSSDGSAYQRLSGTSMAAAFVSGAVAVLRSQYPSLTPAQIAAVLRATARRTLLGAPAGVTGSDPRWRSPLGYGVIDLYAARLELAQPERSQIERLELTHTDDTIEATLWTQRERGAARFVFERAPDVSGAPGAFAAFDSVGAGGDSSLAGFDNRQSYPRSWNVPVGERGVPFWYRVTSTEGGVQSVTAARRFTSPIGPSIATIELTVVHDAYDHDLGGRIWVPASSGTFDIGLPGTSAAVASDWLTGESTTGCLEWKFEIEVPAGAAIAPWSGQPWRLRLDEGGYLNRLGRVTRFAVIWHDGNVTYEGGPVPQQTFEGTSSYVNVPAATTAVATEPEPARVRFGPNPVMAGRAVNFEVPGSAGGTLDVFDLSGRRVARSRFAPSSTGALATWSTRDADGHALPPGVYLARLGSHRTVSVVVLRP